MNTMFTQNESKTQGQTPPEDLDLLPIQSVDDVEKLLKMNESQDFDYFIVRSKKEQILSTQSYNNEAEALMSETVVSASTAHSASAAQVIPPPFRKEAVAPAPAEASDGLEASDIPFLIENADLLLKAGEVNLARNIYRAILKTGESSEIAYAGLAECSDREGLIEQALQFAWDSVAFSPNQRGYQILSQLLIQQGRDRDAASALTRAIKSLDLSVQNKAEYYKVIGNCYSRLGEFADAERSFKKALELSPASDDAQSNLGSLYLEQGQISEAKRCYQDALAANPANDKAWVGLGLCFVSEGDKTQAHNAFLNALQRNLKNSTAVFHLVKCAYETKNYVPAESILSKYIEIAPVSPSLLYSLAGLQFHVGKKRESLNTVKRILQIKADHHGAKELLKRLSEEGIQ